MKRMAIVATLIALLLLGGAVLAQGTPAIPWSVLGGGGGHAETGSIALDGTIGQPMVGQVSNLSYALCAGFWCGTAQYRVYLPLVLRHSL